MRMYLVEVQMSYDDVVEKSKDIDEKHRELTLRYAKKVRKRISYIREKYRREAYSHTVRFYSLHFATEEGVKKITGVIREADRQMKSINQNLYASVLVIPLSLNEIQKRGELYEKIYYAICLQMAEAVFKQVDKLKSDVPTQRTRNNIDKLLRKFKELNVIGDSRINEKIEELEKIVNQSTDKIKEQILSDIEKLREELQDMMVV